MGGDEVIEVEPVDPLNVDEFEAEAAIEISPEVDQGHPDNLEETLFSDLILPCLQPDVFGGEVQDVQPLSDQIEVEAEPEPVSIPQENLIIVTENSGEQKPEMLEEIKNDDEELEDVMPRISGVENVIILESTLVRIPRKTEAERAKLKAQRKAKLIKMSCMRPTDWWSGRKRKKRIKKTEGSAKGFKCPFCDKVLSTRYSLVVHEKIHKNILNYKCSLCSKSFAYTQQLYYHKKSVHQYKNGRYPVSTSQDLPMRTVQNQTPQSQVISSFSDSSASHDFLESKCRPYEATLGTTRDGTIQGEVIPSSAASNKVKHIRELDALSSARYQEDIQSCTVQLYRISPLEIWKKTTSRTRINVPVQCPFCLKISANKMSLRLHIGRQHTSLNERPHHCPLCEKQFCFRADLNHHISGIHNTKNGTQRCPYPECGKLFLNEPTLQLHKLRVHGSAEVKPKTFKFKCDHCVGRVFSTRKNLNDHLTRRHPGKPLNVGQHLHNLPQKESRHLKDDEVQSLDSTKISFNQIAKRTLSPNKQLRPMVPTETIQQNKKEVQKDQIPTVPEMMPRSENTPLVVDAALQERFKLRPCMINIPRQTPLQLWKLTAEAKNTIWTESARCPFCGNDFARKDTLKYHIIRLHMKVEERKYKCPKCDRRFCNRWEMKRHLSIAHNFRRSKPAPRPSSKSAPKLVPPPKPSPDSSGPERADVKRCPVTTCKREFRDETALKIHKLTIHNIQANPRPHKLGRSNVAKTLLDNHVKPSLALQNKIPRQSKKTSSSPVQLTDTSAFQKTEVFETDPSPTHKCPHCPEKFNTQRRLKLHVTLEHGGVGGSNISSQPPTFPTARKADSIQKSIPRKLSSQHSLRRYVKLDHTSRLKRRSNLQAFICLFCGKEFGQYAHLEIHMSRHTSEKHYECDHCFEDFIYPASLHFHLKKKNCSLRKSLEKKENVTSPKKTKTVTSIDSSSMVMREVTEVPVVVTARKSLPPPLPSPPRQPNRFASFHSPVKLENLVIPKESCVPENASLNPSLSPPKKVHLKKLHNTTKTKGRKAKSVSEEHLQGKSEKERCNICQKMITTKNLKRHKALVHQEGEILPSYCESNANANVNAPETCDICQMVISNKGNLNRHKASVHGVGKLPTSNSQKQPISCTICHKLFHMKTVFMRHMFEEHGGKFAVPTESANLGNLNREDDPDEEMKAVPTTSGNRRILKKDKESFKCSECSLDFTSKAKFNTHLKQSHQEASSYFCETCNASFPTISKFHRHVCTENNVTSQEEATPLPLWQEIAADLEKDMATNDAWNSVTAEVDGLPDISMLLNDSDRQFLETICELPLD